MLKTDETPVLLTRRPGNGEGESLVIPTLRIARCSSAALPLLQGHDGIIGHIHSCYARVVNVRTPTGRLLTLQGKGPLQSPLALAIAGGIAALVPSLRVGALVVCEGAEQHHATLQLCEDGAEVWESKLAPLPGITVSGLYRAAAGLHGWLITYAPERGLVPVLQALEGSSGALDPARRRVYETCTTLLTGTGFAPTHCYAILRRFIGLGEGLTPSGDDLLVGLLAMWQAAGEVGPWDSPVARQQLLEYMQTHTTILSAEFLRCALEGHFAEPLLRLVRSLLVGSPAWQAHAAALAAVGHSSGVDTMVGMVLGSRLLARRQVEKTASRYECIHAL